MKTSHLYLLSLGFLLSLSLAIYGETYDSGELKITFGSCFEQDKPNLAMWQAIIDKDPDMFIFLGDNAYIDSDDPAKFAQDYATLLANPGIAKLKNSAAVMATWDDHDFGLNDGGRHFTAKHIAKAAFVKAFDYPELQNIPEDQGIYHSRSIKLNDKTIQLILLDTRWYRDDLLEHNLSEEEHMAFQQGPYRPHWDTSQTLLGRDQWAWLEDRLKQPVDLNIIASSIQFVSEYTAWEIWANFPHERSRLLNMIRSYAPAKTVFISGDVHRGETSSMALDQWELFDITSGPLSSTSYPAKPNIHRRGQVFVENNFGMLTIIDTETGLNVTAAHYDNDGKLLEQHQIPIGLKE